MKYYEFSQQQIVDLENFLPTNVKLGFESYGKWFVAESTINAIDNSHGSLLTLALESIFSDTRENILTANESTSYEQYVDSKEKAEDGFDGYEKIMGNILSLDGLSPSLDTSVQIYNQHLTTIRMLLKDGLFEMCLRYFSLNIKGNSIIPNDDFAEDVIVQLCKKWGVSDEAINAIKLAPNGSI